MPAETSARWRRAARGAVHRALAAAVALLFLLPLAWAVAGALWAPGATARRSADLIPFPPTWGNFGLVFRVVPLDRYALNSLAVAAVAVPATIVVASWAGFAIAQLSPTWRRRLVALSVLCLMVPLTAIWLPRFVLFKEAGLIDNLGALVVPSLMGTSPFYVLLFAWAFLRVPREIYEAARLDGAGPWRTWREIALPLARPAAVAVGVLAFVHYWNSFVEPLLLIRSEEKNTASLGLRVLYSLDRTDWPVLMAGALLVLLPSLLLFAFAQRAFLQDPRGHDLLGR